MTQIIEILEYKPEYLEATRKFLTQLTTRPIQLTEEAFRHTLASANSHLFFLLDDKAVAGMLTVGIYHSPTGGKAWICGGKKRASVFCRTGHGGAGQTVRHAAVSV